MRAGFSHKGLDSELFKQNSPLLFFYFIRKNRVKIKTGREENAVPQCWQYSCSGFGSNSVSISTDPNPLRIQILPSTSEKFRKTLIWTVLWLRNLYREPDLDLFQILDPEFSVRIQGSGSVCGKNWQRIRNTVWWFGRFNKITKNRVEKPFPLIYSGGQPRYLIQELPDAQLELWELLLLRHVRVVNSVLTNLYTNNKSWAKIRGNPAKTRKRARREMGG